MMSRKKPDRVALILEKMGKTASEPEVESSDTMEFEDEDASGMELDQGTVACAEDLCKAIWAKDYEGVAKALLDFLDASKMD